MYISEEQEREYVSSWAGAMLASRPPWLLSPDPKRVERFMNILYSLLNPS